MKVVVEILTGTLFYIQVGNDATVADLKKEIGAQQELPSDRLILLIELDDDDQSHHHHHQLMRDDQDGISLVDCGVKDGSKIYVFFNPLDAAYSQQFVFTLVDDASSQQFLNSDLLM